MPGSGVYFVKSESYLSKEADPPVPLRGGGAARRRLNVENAIMQGLTPCLHLLLLQIPILWPYCG
jgi:hypothetical protein